MADSPADAHNNNFKDLLSSGNYSDLTITCGGDTYKVHKSIVCTRCGFFEPAERFAAGKEAAENKIDLPEDEPEVIRLLLEYLYTSEYTPQLPTTAHVCQNPLDRIEPRHRDIWPHTCGPDCDMFPCEHHECDEECESDCVTMICDVYCPIPKQPQPTAPEDGSCQLLIHSQMYALADKYNVPGLKELAGKKFRPACNAFWEGDDLMIAAEHAFTTTMDNDMGLRGCIKEVLMAHKGIVAQPNVKKFLASQPELMYEILLNVVQ